MQWREVKLTQLNFTQRVLESLQRKEEKSYQTTEDDETGPDPLKARQARDNRRWRTNIAISLRIVRRQLRGLQNQKEEESLIAGWRMEDLDELIMNLRPDGQESGVIDVSPPGRPRSRSI